MTPYLSHSKEWRKRLPHHLSLPPAGPQFYAKVFHPAFNLDAEDAAESVERFSRHLKATGKGVQGLRGMFTGLRMARMGEPMSYSSNGLTSHTTELARYQRLLSYSLMSLIVSTPLATPPTSQSNGPADEEDEEEDTSRVGLLNADGAWCWREHCDGWSQ